MLHASLPCFYKVLFSTLVTWKDFGWPMVMMLVGHEMEIQPRTTVAQYSCSKPHSHMCMNDAVCPFLGLFIWRLVAALGNPGPQLLGDVPVVPFSFLLEHSVLCQCCQEPLQKLNKHLARKPEPYLSAVSERRLKLCSYYLIISSALFKLSKVNPVRKSRIRFSLD